MSEFTEVETHLLDPVTDDRLRTSLALIRQAAVAIWAVDAPRIIQDFTDHGIEHSGRLLGFAAQLLEANDGRPLSSQETYLLLAGIYLHDIGMQCDVVRFPEIKARAEELGAAFGVDFTAQTASGYSIDEQKAIRKNHQYLTAAWIDHASRTGETALGPAAKTVSDDLVDDLMDICMYHAKLPIADCSTGFRFDSTGRKQLVAALLRFADELDVDGHRVSIETVKTFRLDLGDSVYWWLHNRTKVVFDSRNVISLTVRLHPDDVEQYGSAVRAAFIDRFRTKNQPILTVLGKNRIPIVISADSGVVPHDRVDPLPPEIAQTLLLLAAVSLHQLPPPPSDFTGREEELSELTQAITQGGVTISGLRGMGGVGKTALALKLAEQLTPQYPDAQFYLDLQGTSDSPLTPAQAMAHVVRAYHPTVRLPESEAELTGLYHSVLHDQRALLLMDNAAGREQVEPLLCPDCCVLLVTSRRRFMLPGLKALNLDTLPPEDARALLLKIAPRIDGHAGEMAELCGHLPLALRLAGSALAERESLSAGEYVQRLKDMQTRLGLIDASLSVSYDLMEERLQRLWCALGVFPGTFDRAEAAAIWQMEQDPAQAALDELVRYSLVEWCPDTRRYHLLNLARLFASAHLDRDQAKKYEELARQQFVTEERRGQLTLAQLEEYLWDAADILRGEGDASDVMEYVVAMLFLKRANDVFEERRDSILWEQREHGRTEEEARARSERPAYYADVLYVPPRARWPRIRDEYQEQVGDKLNRALAALEQENASLDGALSYIDFNHPVGRTQLTDASLRRLIEHFSKYRLRDEDFEFPDMLGSAYEYLIAQSADSAGKKGGEFYTPRDVASLMVRLLKPQAGKRVYDPGAGSGGMLLLSREYVQETGGNPDDLAIYGQEIDARTWATCKANLLLHGVPDANIRRGDTLHDPLHVEDGELMRFDYVISNPPFSQNYTREEMAHPERFRFGFSPERGKKADLMFLQHMLAVLRPGGVTATVMPHGVLFRGGVEQEIRSKIVEEDLLEAVIGLPPNLFYGTGIPACILILRAPHAKPEGRKGRVLFIDAEAEYQTEGARNHLLPEHVEKIVSAYDAFRDIDRYARVVTLDQVAENEYNLNIKDYVGAVLPSEATGLSECWLTVAHSARTGALVGDTVRLSLVLSSKYPDLGFVQLGESQATKTLELDLVGSGFTAARSRAVDSPRAILPVQLLDAYVMLQDSMQQYSRATSESEVEVAFLALHAGMRRALTAYLATKGREPDLPTVTLPQLVDLVRDHTDLFGDDRIVPRLLVSLNDTRNQIAHATGDKPLPRAISSDAEQFARLIRRFWPTWFGEAWGVSDEPPLRSPEPVSGEVTLHLQVQGFHIREGDDLCTFTLPFVGLDQMEATVELEARLPGVHEIVVDPFFNGIRLGPLTIPISVRWDQEAKHVELPSPLGARPVPQPDVCLRVYALPLNQDASHFRIEYVVYSPHHSLRLPGVPVGSVQLARRDLVRLRARLDHMLRRTDCSGSSERYEGLRSIGRHLYDLFFSPEFRQVYEEIWDKVRSWLILCDPEPWVPWELIKPWGRDWEHDFLAARYSFARWVEGWGAARQTEFPLGSVFVAAAAELAGHHELTEWTELVDCGDVPRLSGPLFIDYPGGYPRAISCWSPTWGLHFVRYPEQLVSSLRRLVETAVERFSPERAAEHRLDLRQKRPLVTFGVLALSQQTALTKVETQWMPTFVQSGASAFAAPLWATSSEADRMFWRAFYQALWNRIPLGEAMLTARESLRQALPDSMDWLAYFVVGDPMAKGYSPPPGEGYVALECQNHDLSQPLRVGQTYAFTASWRAAPPPWYATGRLFQPPQQSWIDPRVYVFAPSFRVPMDPLALEWHEETSGSARFSLTPEIAGEHDIFVKFLSGDQVRQSLAFHVDVESEREAQV